MDGNTKIDTPLDKVEKILHQYGLDVGEEYAERTVSFLCTQRQVHAINTVHGLLKPEHITVQFLRIKKDLTAFALWLDCRHFDTCLIISYKKNPSTGRREDSFLPLWDVEIQNNFMRSVPEIRLKSGTQQTTVVNVSGFSATGVPAQNAHTNTWISGTVTNNNGNTRNQFGTSLYNSTFNGFAGRMLTFNSGANTGKSEKIMLSNGYVITLEKDLSWIPLTGDSFTIV